MKLFLTALCLLALVGCEPPKTMERRAAEVCAKNGGRLATYENDGAGQKFTCADASP